MLIQPKLRMDNCIATNSPPCRQAPPSITRTTTSIRQQALGLYGALITWKVHQRYADGTVSEWTPATTLTQTGNAAK